MRACVCVCVCVPCAFWKRVTSVTGAYSEMARVYGIDFFAVLSRGSQYRVESMMIRLTKLHNYVLISPSRQQVRSHFSLFFFFFGMPNIPLTPENRPSVARRWRRRPRSSAFRW